MGKPYMTLQPTEMALLGTAGRIHAARLASGQVPEGGEEDSLRTAVVESVRLARLIDEGIMADQELE